MARLNILESWITFGIFYINMFKKNSKRKDYILCISAPVLFYMDPVSPPSLKSYWSEYVCNIPVCICTILYVSAYQHFILQGPNVTMGFELTCKAEPDSDREEMLILHGDIGHDIQVCVEKAWRDAIGHFVFQVWLWLFSQLLKDA